MVLFGFSGMVLHFAGGIANTLVLSTNKLRNSGAMLLDTSNMGAGWPHG